MLTVAGLLKIINLLIPFAFFPDMFSCNISWVNKPWKLRVYIVEYEETLCIPFDRSLGRPDQSLHLCRLEASCAACWFMISSRKQLRRFMVTHVYWNRRNTNQKATTKTKTWAFVSQVFMLSVYITFCLSFIPAGITHYLVKELGWTLKKPCTGVNLDLVLERGQSWPIGFEAVVSLPSLQMMDSRIWSYMYIYII